MINIGRSPLSVSQLARIVLNNEEIVIDEAVLNEVDVNHQFLQKFSQNKLIYGINTGFGPMAQYKVSQDSLLQLQYNLIRSHSSGSGKLIEPALCRALMVARLGSLIQARSGVHPEIVELIATLINKNILPCIYEHGGVGASGDLVQLAHLGLMLVGEGEVHYQGGIREASEVFAENNIKPLTIHVREGLAILNGTSAMTGIGCLNIVKAQNLLSWGVMLSALTNEVVEAYNDHYSTELNVVKHHNGQLKVASLMQEALNGSKMIRDRSEHLYNPDNIGHDVFEDKVQEYYSLRCVTQILGPVYDTIAHAEKILTEELNSVNDNPVIDHVNHNVFHGGNFHGDYVSLEMDKLKIAITRLAMLSERQLNYLLNNKLNQKFPPFVNMGVLGLNFGMQGIQFTAVSTVAENQTLAFPMYVHSIPNNNDNQDIVSMGCNGALMTKRVIDNSYEVLAIQLMTIAQAVAYLDCRESLSPLSAKVYDAVRAIFPAFKDDQPRYKEQRLVKEYMEASTPLKAFEA